MTPRQFKILQQAIESELAKQPKPKPKPKPNLNLLTISEH